MHVCVCVCVCVFVCVGVCVCVHVVCVYVYVSVCVLLKCVKEFSENTENVKYFLHLIIRIVLLFIEIGIEIFV